MNISDKLNSILIEYSSGNKESAYKKFKKIYLKNIDVFVTVSNSTAHFAGALGVPTILICPKQSSTYYYWDYENGKTPWYDSISIIKVRHSLNYTMKLVDELIDNI